MSEKDEITRKLRKMMAMGATPEHGLIVVRWHYISTIEEWRNDVDLCADAADEIERLTAAADEIERLTAERDEARRMVCSEYAFEGRDIAAERGWDYLKEDGKCSNG
jgi:hypothetical protein